MALGPVVKSVLKETIKELPDDYTRKSAATATNELLKKGVKQEEMNFSGFKLPDGPVTKQTLVDAEASRSDWFKTIEKNTYQTVNIDENNPTYREKILTFGRKGEAGYTSSHFPEDENYLMHVRVQDDSIDGKKTRVLLEIQSDLHQEARSTGYAGVKPGFEKLQAMKKDFDAGNIDTETFMAEMQSKGYTGGPELPSIDKFFQDNVISEKAVPKSPYEKNWLAKGIEQELVDAVNEGSEQLVVPISGERIADLHRSPGVQKWYETTVVNTMKKIAKQTGSDFVMDTPKAPTPLKLNFSQVELDKVRAEYETLVSKARAGEIDYRDPNDFVGNFIASKQAGLEELNPGVEINHFDLIADITQDGKTVEQFTTAVETADISYARIIPRNKDFSVSLYSTPIAGAFVAYQAYQAGMTEDEVNAKLTEYGYDDEDLEEVSRRVQVISQAQEAGMSLEDIRTRMEEADVTVTGVESEPGPLPPEEPTHTPKNVKYEALVDEDAEMTAEELVSSLKVLHPTMASDTLTTIPAFFGSQKAQQRYDKAREASRAKIVNIAKNKYGLDLYWEPDGVGSEGWYVQTEDGFTEVTPGFWEDFKKSTGEITGAVAGAIAGGPIGARVVAGLALSAGIAGPQAAIPEEILTVPIGAGLGYLGGMAVGGITGAMAGSQVDYLYQAMKLQEDMEAEAMAYKAFNAFELAAVGEIIGYPIAKGLGAGWRGIVNAKNYVTSGESRRAYKSLKETTFLSDSQIDEIVMQMEKFTALEGNRYQKGVQAVALSEPGMQDLVRAAGGTNPKASSATAKAVIDRAEGVLTRTSLLTDEQVPRILAKDLSNYTSDVREQYAKVKARAVQTPRGSDFQWEFDDLAIQPVLDDLREKIVDPTTKEKFLLQLQRVNAMSENREFGDLLELRQMTNDFLYNKNITKADDKATLRGVIQNIDEAIEKGAHSVMDDPKQWLDDWAKARADYSKMKQVEKTAMYRTMFNKDGSMRAVNPDEVVGALSKYITSIDGSFEEIMSLLPMEGRKMYEGAVVDALTKRFTAGVEQGAKAIHFPMLADELRKISLTTPDARAAKEGLIMLGETFKNDVWLAKTSGQITIPQFQSFLTTDPTVRAKYEVASGVFNYIKSKAPGASNRQLALVRATAKLLEKPLDSKNFKLLQEEVFGDANLSARILDVQRQAAADRAKHVDSSTPIVKVFAGGKLKGSGPSTSIPAHRIMTLQQVKEIADTEAITLDSKSLDAVLRKYGFEAVQEGSDRVRILGDK